MDAIAYVFAEWGDMYVRAIQITEDNINEVANWCEGEVVDLRGDGSIIKEEWRLSVRFQSLTGTEWAKIGWWIVRYDDNTFYPYPDDSFKRLFKIKD